MTTLVFKTKVKTYQEVWRRDKELLSPIMQLDGDMPTSEGAMKIFIARQNRWKAPQEPFVLTKGSLEAVLGSLKDDLTSICGCEIPEMPIMEICELPDYLPRLQELDRELNKAFGYGGVIQSPPTMGSFPFFKDIVMPRKFIVREPRTQYATSVESADFYTSEHEWDKAFLEEALFGQLACALLRQVRGEWGEDYLKTIKKIGPEGQSAAYFLYDSAVQFAKEQAAARRGWNLYVVGEKIGVAWQSRGGMETYRAIDALSPFGRLADICKADELSPSPTEVSATFNLQNPHFARKYRDFRENIKINRA